MVEVFELLSYRGVSEKFQGLSKSKVRDISPTLKFLGESKVVVQLHIPRKLIERLFAIIKLPKPCSNQRASRAGFENNGFEPFESSYSEFKLHRKDTNFFHDLHITDRGVLVVRVFAVRFSKEKRSTTRENEVVEFVILSIGENKRFSAREERIVHHIDEAEPSDKKRSVFISDQLGKHVPFSPGSIEPGTDFFGVLAIIGKKNTQVFQVGKQFPATQFVFPDLPLKGSRPFAKDRNGDLLFFRVLGHSDGPNVVSQSVVGRFDKLFDAFLI